MHLAEDTADDGTRASRPSRAARAARLHVTVEFDRPWAGSARFSLHDADVVVIGRGDELRCSRVAPGHIDLRLPAKAMSATQARLQRSGEVWRIEDARSRHGTFVNGERIVGRVLGDGDLIELGRVALMFREGEASIDVPTSRSEPVGLRTRIPSLESRIDALKRLAPTTVPVLILGETGTGKELVARAVHALSLRSGPFVAVNCAALAPGLFESQLFGHKRGAFSSAVSDEPGFVRSAAGGTLFLDEVGDLPLPAQAAILRVLQEGEVVPVGSSRAVPVDMRIVSATGRPIDDEGSGFRRDLYARLAGFVFSPPPLRERREDMGIIVGDILAARFPERARDFVIGTDAGAWLMRYDWPLNVRELEQAVRAAVAMADDGVLRFGAPPARPGSAPRIPASSHGPRDVPGDSEGLRESLVAGLQAHRGNVAAVARAMGKAPMQVYRWLRRFDIDVSAFRAE